MKSRTMMVCALLAAQPVITGCNQGSGDSQIPPGGGGPRPPQSDDSDSGDVGISVYMARGFEASMGGSGGGGPRYELMFEVGNPRAKTEFRFGSVEIFFTDGIGNKFDHTSQLTGETIVLTDTNIHTAYHYGDDKGAKGLVDTSKVEDTIIEGHRAIQFPASIGSGLMATITGKRLTVMNVTLISGGKQVTKVYRVVLPPIMKIPSEMEVVSRDKWMKMRLWAEERVPASSGIFDQATVDKAFEKAGGISSSAVLSSVTPLLLNATTYKGGSSMEFPMNWEYKFWSPEQCVSVPQIDPTAVKKIAFDKPAASLDKGMLKSCIVDFDTATMMLELVGTNTNEKGSRCGLVAVTVEGKTRPLWQTGYRIKGKRASVLADTGEVVYEEAGTFKPFDVIWN